MRYNILFSFSVLLIACCACQKEISGGLINISGTIYDSIPVAKVLNPIINEGSGIVASKINPGFIWVQEDSGNPTQLSLLAQNGTVLKSIFIKNSFNRDWEAMTLSGNDLYVADIGDNAQIFATYSIYKFVEPISTVDTITTVDTIQFQYPDGSHDAEAFLIDPLSKDIFIITKRDFPARVYKLSFPYAPLSTLTLTGTIPVFSVTDAALSPDGKEVLIRTYTSILNYIREPGQSIFQTLQSSYKSLPHQMEPMGEAITFAIDNSGFFTLSEKASASSVNLYFYKKR